MKPILGLLFVIFTISAKAQFVEKIYLKDSITIYTGWIVEQVPQDYLKILRQKERDTIIVNTDRILKIVRVINVKADNMFSPAPEGRRQQAVFLEGGGAGFLYSVNYDFRLQKGRRDKWGMRVGISVFGGDITVDSVRKIGRITLVALPIQVNYLIGARKSALELGAGVTPLFAAGVIDSSASVYYFDNFKKRASAFYPAVNALIGYRFTSLNNGFMFRATLNPSIVYGEFIPSIGLSVGYHFSGKKKKNNSVELIQR